METFETELKQLLNKYSRENNSDTPDYILALYLTNCLLAYEEAIINRDAWHGRAINTKKVVA